MILCLRGVLSASERRTLVRRLAKARFVAGRRTAGWHARAVKRNEQLASPGEIGKTIIATLEANETFRAAARPLRYSPVLINRHRTGMTYGTHVDDAMMRSGDGGPLRSDISVTVFLSDPKTYEGGELVIEDTAGERAFRLEAGDALLYPATTLHRVEPVDKGERLAAVLWVQSLVPDPARRELLFDLDVARRAMFQASGKTPAFDLIAKSHANLLRMWSRP